MPDRDFLRGVPSTAAIRQHPIHPMLIPFPIAFLSAVVVTDLVYRVTREPLWAEFSFWLLLAGLATGVLASIFGLIDFFTIKLARSYLAGWVHFLGNAAALILALINLVIRWGDVDGAVLPWGLALSVIVVLLLVITGWYGGELSYRHRIGVMDVSEDDVRPER